MSSMKGIEITGKIRPAYKKILTPEALSFVAKLVRKHSAKREQLLELRKERQARIDSGKLPGFLPETKAIRSGKWKVASIPKDLQDRRVEITGPVDRKMIINALNSGAKCFMADFEDSASPTWDLMVEGHINLRDAVAKKISFKSPEGKEYKLNKEVATLIVRPRGWHLDEKHILIDGKPAPGGIVDFGLYFFHNAKALMENGSGPYFYLPKMQSHLEAKLWNSVFVDAQALLGIPKKTIKVTVLIETLWAAFEMDEILYALKDHIVALNCGRWDYIFSCIKTLNAHGDWMVPDRHTVGMDRHFLDSYSKLLCQTCHKRGAMAMGGELHAGAAEGAGDGGIGVGAAEVGGVEFIDDFRLGAEAGGGGERDGVVVEIGEEIAALLVAGDEVGGIPLEGAALHVGVEVGLEHGEPVAHVVEDGIAVARVAEGAGHAVDVVEGEGVVVVAGFVVDFDGDEVGVGVIGEAGEGVHVLDELGEVTLLQRPGGAVFQRALLAVGAGEAGQRGARLGVAGIAELEGREDDPDAARLEFRHEIIERAHVVVDEEVAGGVADLAIPDVDAVGGEAEAGEVIDVGVNGLFEGNAETAMGTEGVGEGRGVVDAELGEFRAGGGPAQDALGIDERAGDGGGLRRDGGARADERAGERGGGKGGEKPAGGLGHGVAGERATIGRVGAKCGRRPRIL